MFLAKPSKTGCAVKFHHLRRRKKKQKSAAQFGSVQMVDRNHFRSSATVIESFSTVRPH